MSTRWLHKKRISRETHDNEKVRIKQNPNQRIDFRSAGCGFNLNNAVERENLHAVEQETLISEERENLPRSAERNTTEYQSSVASG